MCRWVAFFIAFYAFLPFHGHGQNQVADSLLAKIDMEQADTAVLDAMLGQAFTLSFSQPGPALYIADSVRVLAGRMKQEKREINAVLVQGIIYRSQAALDLAMESFLLTLEMSKKINLKTGIGSAYNNIATIESAQGRKREAIVSYRQARKIMQQSKRPQNASIPWANIATSYYELGDIALAKTTFDSVIAELRSFDDRRGLSTAYHNLGSLYKDEGDFERAISLYQESLDLKVEFKDWVSSAEVLCNYADLHLKRSELDSAEAKAQRSLAMAQKAGAATQLPVSLKLLSDIADAKGESEKALLLFRRSVEVDDSLNTDEQQSRLAQLESLYGLELRDKQIELLQKNQEVQEAVSARRNYFNYLLLGGLALMLVALGLLIYAYYVRSKTNRELKLKNGQIGAQQTQILEQNEDLRGKNEKLEQLNHEMDGILHIVAHDLKAPLNQTTGLANLVEISGPLTEEQQKYLKMIARVNTDAGLLVKDLIDLHKIENPDGELQKQRLDLAEILIEVGRNFEGEALRKRIELEIDEEKARGYIESDRGFLLRILDNLVSNAIKFSTDGKKVQISGRVEAAQFILEVQDQGPGISPEDQRKMFRKFQRLSALPTGGESSTGLGLAITKSLVERLGGEIKLRSSLGSGTTFSLYFPRHSSS